MPYYRVRYHHDVLVRETREVTFEADSESAVSQMWIDMASVWDVGATVNELVLDVLDSKLGEIEEVQP